MMYKKNIYIMKPLKLPLLNHDNEKCRLTFRDLHCDIYNTDRITTPPTFAENLKDGRGSWVQVERIEDKS